MEPVVLENLISCCTHDDILVSSALKWAQLKICLKREQAYENFNLPFKYSETIDIFFWDLFSLWYFNENFPPRYMGISLKPEQGLYIILD